MVACLQGRRASVLATAKWLAREWDDTSNSLHPSIYEKGLVLASLLEEIDNANLSSSSGSTQFYFLQRCLGMDTDLDIWYEEFIIRTPASTYWPTPTELDTCPDPTSATSGPKGLSRLSFTNLSIASTTVTFWALKIFISSTIEIACSTILSSNSRKESVVSFNTAGAEGVTDPSDPALSLEGITAKAQRLSNQYNFAQRVTFATLIVRSTPYCLNFSMGLLGPQRIFFALRTALTMLKNNPSPEQAWVKSNHRMLAERYVNSMSDYGSLRLRLQRHFLHYMLLLA